jgi:hypothetical protein
MKCEICGKTSPMPPDGDGISLFRVNETGEPAVWRCEQHLTKEQRAKIPSTVIELAKIIEGSARDEIEDKLEELWLIQKGVDPDTGKMWLTPRMEREAKILAEQGMPDVHPAVSLAFGALARGQSGYLIDDEDERAEAASIDRQIEEEQVEQIIADKAAKTACHIDGIDPEDDEDDEDEDDDDDDEDDDDVDNDSDQDAE